MQNLVKATAAPRHQFRIGIGNVHWFGNTTYAPKTYVKTHSILNKMFVLSFCPYRHKMQPQKCTICEWSRYLCGPEKLYFNYSALAQMNWRFCLSRYFDSTRVDIRTCVNCAIYAKSIAKYFGLASRPASNCSPIK